MRILSGPYQMFFFLAHEQGGDMRKKDFDEKINKLTKENNDLTLKLETYIEEMEELDSKVEALETENTELKEQFNRLKNIEVVGSSIDTIQNLETQIKSLEGKLKKEKQHKEIAENELFKIEEEYENYKISVEKDDQISLLSSRDSLIVENENEDEDLTMTIKRKQLIINNLDAERNELQSKIQTLEQVRYANTTRKMKFSIKDFFSKCDQNRSFLRIWSHVLKKPIMENFISCTVKDIVFEFEFD